jgi:hypothetical protein
MSSPEALAQRQLDAYNARDLEAFLACYHPEVEVRDFPSGKLTMSGREAMRERYGELFERAPELHAALVSRTAHAQVAIDTEAVTGLREGETVHAIAIYEVEGESIRRVWFVKERG